MFSQFFCKIALVVACTGGGCHARRAHVFSADSREQATQSSRSWTGIARASDSLAQVGESNGRARSEEAAFDIQSSKIRGWLTALFYLSLFTTPSSAFSIRAGQFGGALRAANATSLGSAHLPYGGHRRPHLALRGMRRGGPLLMARNQEDIDDILSKVNSGSDRENYLMKDRAKLIFSYVDSHELLEADNAMGVLPNQIQRDPNADQLVYVDEDRCIGCTYCSSEASNTFRMEDDVGAARVFQQGSDTPEVIQTAIDCCPVECIHYVTFNELRILEQSKRAILSTDAGAMERMRTVARRRSFGVDSQEAKGPTWREPLNRMDPRSFAAAESKVREGKGLEQPDTNTTDSLDNVGEEAPDEEDNQWILDALYGEQVDEQIDSDEQVEQSKLNRLNEAWIMPELGEVDEQNEQIEENQKGLDDEQMSAIFDVTDDDAGEIQNS